MQVTSFLIGIILGMLALVALLLVTWFAGGIHRAKKAEVSHAGRNVPPAALFVTRVAGGALRFDLTTSPVRVGREQDNDLIVTTHVLGWDTVSRHHARIYYDARRSRWIVKDEASRNGTYVNGVRTGHNVLEDGVRLTFGGVQALFRACPKLRSEPSGSALLQARDRPVEGRS